MKTWIGALCAGLLLAGSIATDAAACGDEYEAVRVARKPRPRPIPQEERIPMAARHLDEDQVLEATAQVLAAFPALRATEEGSSPLEARAQRILALATVRGEAPKAADVQWAVRTLRAVSASRPDDPVAQADLGEALASQPATENEALAVLSDLAGRDLVGSAHAYAALARLYPTTGRADESRAAIERCRLMTKAPASTCRAPDARVALR